jgi:hypothetical protein
LWQFVPGPGKFTRLFAALGEAYKVGQKPMGADMIENVLSKDINGLEPKLIRQGTTRRSWLSFSMQSRAKSSRS